MKEDIIPILQDEYISSTYCIEIAVSKLPLTFTVIETTFSAKAIIFIPGLVDFNINKQ